MNAPAQKPTAEDIAKLAEALRPALLRLSRRVRQQSQSLGLSPQDTMVLGALRKFPGIGVSELADHEQVTRPSMSAQVKRLEEAGYLARQEPDAEDRRRVGLTLTPKGGKALDAVRRRRNDWLARQLAELTPDQLSALEAAIEPLARLAGERS